MHILKIFCVFLGVFTLVTNTYGEGYPLKSIDTTKKSKPINFELNEQGIYKLITKNQDGKDSIFKLSKKEDCWVAEDFNDDGNWVSVGCSSETHSLKNSSSADIEKIIDTELPPAYLGAIGCLQSPIFAICRQTRTGDPNPRYLLVMMIDGQKRTILLARTENQ